MAPTNSTSLVGQRENPVGRGPLSPLEWRFYAEICQHPEHGATSVWLRERVHSMGGQPLDLSTINAILDRLLSKGWVRKESEHPAGGGRALRAFYFPQVPIEEGLKQIVAHFLSSYELDPEATRQALARIAQPTI